jgi:hypothetical protein
MARTLLGGIAIAAGTGLAIGFCAFGRRRAHSRALQPASLEPLIERLDRIEARVTQAEWRPAPELSGKLSADVAAVRTSLDIIDGRLAAQSHEIDLLRMRSTENESIAAAEIHLNERRFKEIAAALPTEIEAVVVPRVEDLRERLLTEMKESMASALQTLEQSLDTRVSSRITAFEDKLLEHSASLAELSHRTSQANSNLQKLVDAVERLCNQRAPEPEMVAAPKPTSFKMSFEQQPLQASAESPRPVARAVATVPETPAWRIVPEHEPSRRSRVTFAHFMIAAAAAFIGVRFVR